jgi:hypothetical protein
MTLALVVALDSLRGQPRSIHPFKPDPSYTSYNLEWVDRNDPKLSERKAVKLLRRVFDEQFETLGLGPLFSHRPLR